MIKDEMKDKISMALKDPVLQQGFEIICKNLAELEKENAELRELVKKVFWFVNNTIEFDPEHPQEHTNLWNELCEKAEQFLKEVEDEKDNLCFKLE